MWQKMCELLCLLGLLLAPGASMVCSAQNTSVESPIQQHIAQSVANYTHGNLGQAIEQLRAAQQLAPDDPQVNFMLGNALYRYGDITGAAAAYGKTVRVKPSHFEAHMSRGFALFEIGKVDQAVDEWTTAKRLELREPFARAALAVGLYASGRVEEATLQYAGAVALSARYGDLASLRMDIRWKSAALNIAKRLLELMQTNR